MEIVSWQQNDMVMVSVRDNGPGVSPQDCSKIFGTFLQSTVARQEDHQGLGLSLRMCVEFARMHGGNLIYENPKGGGARFVLQLPSHEHVEVG